MHACQPFLPLLQPITKNVCKLRQDSFLTFLKFPEIGVEPKLGHKVYKCLQNKFNVKNKTRYTPHVSASHRLSLDV